MDSLTALLVAGISQDRVTDWLVTHGARIVGIIVVLGIMLLVFRHMVPRFLDTTIRARMEDQPEVEIEKRTKTLTSVFVCTAEVVLVLVALFMVLPELGVNVAPVLAGVGIAGIALGFGAQTLVHDTINGLFILVENQYGIGDVVNVAGIGGLVEEVNLRRTVLRDLDGAVHSIPNSEIKVATNLTREWSRVNMNVSVAYGEDLDKVTEVVNRVGQELARDEEFGPLILSPPQVLRVDNFGESGIEIKILGETKPIRQWDVMGELRKRLKKAFDEEDIEIPFPHTVLVTAGAKATRAAARK
jgi:small conductance mechanosensitive channel